MKNSCNIIFLHHSTGNSILKEGKRTYRILVNYKIQSFFVANWFKKYNQSHGTNYTFNEQYFPKNKLYGWNNYPYDYYNIWVKNAGEQTYERTYIRNTIKEI